MFNLKFLIMKKFTQFSLIGIIVLLSIIISNAQTQGPILASKLETPENVVKQNIKKDRRFGLMANGKWKIINMYGLVVTGKLKKLDISL